MRLADLTVAPPSPGSSDWNEKGVVHIPSMIPFSLIDSYRECWERENRERPGGWPDCTPYMRHPELKMIVCNEPIAETLRDLLGEPAGVHLNLTGLVSTERDWHQDTYLNPPHVGDYYAAVWIALDDIHPDSGVFQYVPGSHRWPVVTREKILAALEPQERDHRWPKFSERILSPLFEQEIAERKAEIVSYVPKKGDVLFWHGRLVHRGSKAKIRGALRPALIAHYSGINHRQDMPKAVPHYFGHYFPLHGPSNV